jgi:acetyl esterase
MASVRRSIGWAMTTSAFVDEAAIAEAQAFNAELERMLAELPRPDTVPPEVTRQARREGRGFFPAPVFLPQARELSAPGRSGDIRLRVLAPETEATGIYFHIHGGGMCLGACDEQDERLWALVEATALCVVSVEYRLAPEHPYPAGPDDCEDAALWLLEHGAAELDAPAVFAIGGESAGGYLSALTLLRLRDRHDAGGAFRAANLVYGVYDQSLTPSQRLWGERYLVLSTPLIEWFSDQYLPNIPRDERRDPDVSPLYADLQDLPPALFTVGDLDPLLDDTLFMQARWRAAGNETELRVYPEGVHAFNYFPLALGRACNEDQYDFLRSRVGSFASDPT